ncbi:PAS domain S-box protein, partial [Hymenobacter sp. H14-R3]|uniref:PAS domain-containing protein n=1 Tax=Hymenobacter sp. H14-R3 TaxID=3046308 RepID=UPI0024BA04A2
MKESEKKYRRLLEASQDVVVTIDTAGNILDTNEAAVTLTGVKRDTLLGANFFAFFTEPELVEEAYQKVLATGAVSNVPFTLRHITGRLTEVLFDGSVNKDDQGILVGAVLVAREVAEKNWATELGIANKELAFQHNEKEKRADELSIANEELAFQNDEKEKRAAELGIANKELAFQNDEKVKRAAELRVANYARGLIEASRDPLVTISPEGKITDMNLATVYITGMERAQLIGSDFFAYFTDPQMAREVYQEVFAKGTVADSPLTLRHKDGKLTDVLFNGSVYKNDEGKVLGVVIVARDVTDQKRIATELIEAKFAAERATVRAEEAQAKAESATGIAENAVKAKQQFLSNMSHEIRT